jgi:hypothetical protein
VTQPHETRHSLLTPTEIATVIQIDNKNLYKAVVDIEAQHSFEVERLKSKLTAKNLESQANAISKPGLCLSPGTTPSSFPSSPNSASNNHSR